MPRPRKCRKVCFLPQSSLFGPLSADKPEVEMVFMTVDEYETIRLIDLEGMTQEECSEKMDVARTTVQRIYNDARYKLAMSLVEGKRLQIQGGDYKLCDKENPACGCRGCCRKNKGGAGAPPFPSDYSLYSFPMLQHLPRALPVLIYCLPGISNRTGLTFS